MKRAILRQTAHRPWPLPPGPWVMTQTWHDLLFVHWRIGIDLLRPRIPHELEIDTFDGSAWIGVLPFDMTGVRLRAAPPIPGATAFSELNVRTYVRHGARSGVWFFSLDANSALGVAGARLVHLPYFKARMSCERIGDEVAFSSERTHRKAPPAKLVARYAPAGPVQHVSPGTLEHWLSERYCLFTIDAHGRLLRGEIHHPPWPIQRASARIESCTMLEAHGLEQPAGDPHLMFARRQEVLLWPIKHDHEESILRAPAADEAHALQ
jgi:uncharacterized protein YqjF (DUF2071 family)